MKKDRNRSWMKRFKQFLQHKPQNKEELITTLRDAQCRNLIDSDTLGMIEGLIHFSQMRVRDIMLPKNQMICLSQGESRRKVLDTVIKTGHSRFPVLEEDETTLLGVLHTKDLLHTLAENDQDLDLKTLVRTVTFVPESKRLDILLSEFKNTRNHMAVVVDEYGAISGFVTIEDLIEQIIGDIEDEFDIDEEAYIKKHLNHQYIVKAHTPVDVFNQEVGAAFTDQIYDTIGGIVMAAFGRLPKRGELITIDKFEFKILNADARRIKLLACHDRRSSPGHPFQHADVAVKK